MALRKLLLFGLTIGLTVGGLACAPATKPVLPAFKSPLSVPHADPDRFSVLVAEFARDDDENRDGVGDTTTQLRREFDAWGGEGRQKEGKMGPEVLVLHSIVNTELRENGGYHDHEEARRWLVKTGARVILWGFVLEGQTERHVVLRLTGSRDRPQGNAFPLEMEWVISTGQWVKVFPVIRLALAIEATGYEDLEGLGLRDELPQLVPLVEEQKSARPGRVESLVALALQARASRTGEVGLLRRALTMLQEVATTDKPTAEAAVPRARLRAMQASVLADWYELETNEGALLEAIAAYREAAKELTMSRTPWDFAIVHNQLGRLHERMALQNQSEAPHCAAVDAFWQAAQVTYDGDVPQYMDTTLRGVQRNLSSLTRRLPSGQKPECTPPIDDVLWRTFQASEDVRAGRGK